MFCSDHERVGGPNVKVHLEAIKMFISMEYQGSWHQYILFFFLGLLDVKVLKPETPEYKKFEEQVRIKTAEPPFNYVIPPNEEVGIT